MAKDIDDMKEMVINESADGSATIDLPDDIPSPQNTKSDDDSGADDDAAERAEIEAHGSVDPEQEALREQRRNKRRARKDYHKQVSTEKDMRLNNLQRQNQELLERLSIVERKTQGSEMARLNKAIEDQETRILFANQKIKEAVESGNGDLVISAQEMLYEARRNAESLTHLKRQATSQPQQQTIQAPNMAVQRHASEWMGKNGWYDPNGSDIDSKVALTIDQAMAEEGWNPQSREYWEELDNRLQKHLPHRYNDDSDDYPSERAKPRSAVTSSGREGARSSGSKNSFTLSADQVRAMKDAGLWDDTDKRAKMIKRYALEARQRNTGA
jgi:spore coat protein CotF